MENSGVNLSIHRPILALQPYLGTSLLHRYSGRGTGFHTLEVRPAGPLTHYEVVEEPLLSCRLSKTTEVVMVGKDIRGSKVAFSSTC